MWDKCKSLDSRVSHPYSAADQQAITQHPLTASGWKAGIHIPSVEETSLHA